MKFCILFLCVASFFWLEVNANCPPLNNPKGAKTVREGTIKYKNCSKFTCQNGEWGGLSCAVFRCEEQTGETSYDYSKPYPKCCPQPICPQKH